MDGTQDIIPSKGPHHDPNNPAVCKKCLHMVNAWGSPLFYGLTSRRYQTYARIKTSAQNGCRLCAMILAAWGSKNPEFCNTNAPIQLKVEVQENEIEITDPRSPSCAKAYISGRKDLCKW